MAVFHSRPSPSDLSRRVQKHPALFGVPFVLLMVAASYGLTMFTQTRYDLHDQKVKQVSTPLAAHAYAYGGAADDQGAGTQAQEGQEKV